MIPLSPGLVGLVLFLIITYAVGRYVYPDKPRASFLLSMMLGVVALIIFTVLTTVLKAVNNGHGRWLVPLLAVAIYVGVVFVARRARIANGEITPKRGSSGGTPRN